MTKHPAQWTLGQMIDALKGRNPDAQVRFTFANMCVFGVDSYRGYYEDLALDVDFFRHADPKKKTKLQLDTRGLLSLLEQSVGQVFTGYKGGDYEASRDTALWVSKYGDCSNTIVTGIDESYLGATLILTGYAP